MNDDLQTISGKEMQRLLMLGRHALAHARKAPDFPRGFRVSRSPRAPLRYLRKDVVAWINARMDAARVEVVARA